MPQPSFSSRAPLERHQLPTGNRAAHEDSKIALRLQADAMSVLNSNDGVREKAEKTAERQALKASSMDRQAKNRQALLITYSDQYILKLNETLGHWPEISDTP